MPPPPTPPFATGANGNGEIAKPTSNHGTGGRFVVENQAAKGHGNPFMRRLAELRKLVVETVGDDGLRQLIQSLLKQALAGDVAAARTILMYTVGRPQTAVDPDACDLHEFDLLRQRPGKGEALVVLVDTVNPAAFSRVVQQVDQAEAKESAEGLARSLTDIPDKLDEFQAERAARRRRRK
jgi:hypothetical protein